MKSVLDLLDGYITNNPTLSRGTIAIYERLAKKYDDIDLTKATYQDIMQIVKRETNPNTQAAVLNLAIILTKTRYELHNRLQKEREPLNNEIDSRRKKKLKEDNEDLPNYDDLVDVLQSMTGTDYLINYMLINYAFRNSDFMLKNINLKKDIPEDKENYVYYNKKLRCISLLISNYKTSKSYGKKVISINDPKFLKIFKDLNLQDGDYLLTTNKGSKPSISYLADIVQRKSISGLGEGRIFKIIVKDLLSKHKYKKLEEVSASRGTSLAVILSSYNMMNNEGV